MTGGQAQGASPFPSGELPDAPAAALLFAAAFRQLGGSFHIDQSGPCRIVPEPGLYRGLGNEIPQFPDAEPWERFHSAEQWAGAMQMVQFVLDRLSPRDKHLVYHTMAAVWADDPGAFDFRELMQ